MWLTTAAKREPIDQAAGLRQWVEKCEDRQRKKVPSAPIVAVTGGIPAERIRLWTLHLAMTAAADGTPTLVCHEQPFARCPAGSCEFPNSPVKPFSGEPTEPAQDKLGGEPLQNQAAGLQRRQVSGAIWAEETPGGTYSGQPARPAVLHVLPHLFQAVLPSGLNVPADWPVIGPGTWTFVEALPDNDEWFRSWQSQTTTLLLVSSPHRKSQIDTYLLVKRLRAYRGGIFLAVEHQDTRKAKQVYHHIARAIRQFLGLSPRYAGRLPPPGFCQPVASAENILLYRRILQCLSDRGTA